MTRTPPLRYRIYNELLKGKYPSQIAREFNAKPQKIDYHVRVLESNEIVQKEGGKSYPQFYIKGKNATFFEEANKHLKEDFKSHGKAVEHTKKPIPIRTHSTGCIIAPVLRFNDLEKIFPDPPSQIQGSQFWTSKTNNLTIRFQLTNKGSMLFYVYPPSIELASSELSYLPEDFVKEADRVINQIQKKYDWRFGPSRPYHGETHFAIAEDSWFDGSLDKFECETTNLKKVWMWANIDILEEQLHDEIEGVRQYVEELESVVAPKLLKIYEILNQLKSPKPDDSDMMYQ